MFSEDKPSSDKLFERVNFTGLVDTKLVVTQKNAQILKHSYRVPKWLIYFGTLTSVFVITIFLSAICVVYLSPRPALYLENCKARSCEAKLRMKCLNDVCNCTTNQYYLKGCIEKKTFDAMCSYEAQCTSNLNCLNGACACEIMDFWSGVKCLPRRGYGEHCVRSDQCLNNLLLVCLNGLCSCDSTRFWNEYVCWRRNDYGEPCRNSSIECLQSKHLACISGTCLCEATYYYFNVTSFKCDAKNNETEYCEHDYQCLGDMVCVGIGFNRKCECSSSIDYFNYTQVTCVPKTSVNTYCQATDRTCRTDLRLTCQANLCKCNGATQFWYNSSVGCINYFSYNQSTCFDDSNCSPGALLFCNKNSTQNECSCPVSSRDGMCDCMRIFGNEYYWCSSSATCKRAHYEWSPCNSSYQCWSPMECNSTSKQCQCAYNYYFNTTSLTCFEQTLVDTQCSFNYTCQMSLGLSCQNNLCQCDAAKQFWFNSSVGCVDYFVYNQSMCYSNSNCKAGLDLFCNLDTSLNTCNCPLVSFNGMCDCVRVSGNEYYWNTSHCRPAKGEWHSCAHSYECITPMYCNVSIGICQCDVNFYYNASADDCLPKTLVNTYCTNTSTCRTDYGLSCQSNLCKCNETTQFWYDSTHGCVDYFTYDQFTHGCYADSNCLPNTSLFCNLDLTANTCNCPSLSRYGTCDCVRVYKNESYWDFISSKCKPAMSEWSTCNDTYECMSDMMCHSSLKQCQCDDTEYFDEIAYICTPKTLNNTYCSSTNTCRIDLGLSCQSNRCKCNESTQFWSNSTDGCLNYFSYGQQGCSSDNQCKPDSSLFCNLNVLTSTCNCPSISLNGMCDCVRTASNETYWDLTFLQCTRVTSENGACNFTYQCASSLICNSSSKTCQCSSDHYFNSNTRICEAKTLNNTYCTSDTTCRTDLGLTCQLNLCKCDELTKFWSNSTNGCVNYFNYGQMGCSSNSQCSPGKSLICNVNATANPCNCPTTSVTGMCDCLRVVGNESYWNSSLDRCVAASSINSSCTSGNSFTCQTLTQRLSCSFDRCQCMIGSIVGFLRSNNVCGYCPSGWRYVSASDLCYSFTLMNPQCGNNDHNCVIRRCTTFYNGSIGAIIDNSTMFSSIANAFSGAFAIAMYIGGYFVQPSWYWSDGSLMRLPLNKTIGQWSPNSDLNPSGQPTCLAIQAGPTPNYFYNEKCSEPLNLLCQIAP